MAALGGLGCDAHARFSLMPRGRAHVSVLLDMPFRDATHLGAFGFGRLNAASKISLIWAGVRESGWAVRLEQGRPIDHCTLTVCLVHLADRRRVPSESRTIRTLGICGSTPSSSRVLPASRAWRAARRERTLPSAGGRTDAGLPHVGRPRGAHAVRGTGRPAAPSAMDQRVLRVPRGGALKARGPNLLFWIVSGRLLRLPVNTFHNH